MKNCKLPLALTLLALFAPLLANAAVTLPRLVGNGMVLQRNQQITLRGGAEPRESVSVSFRGKTYSTAADDSGRWQVALPEMPAGGPYTLEVRAENNLVVENVLIGDVWLASGQSNMELPMKRVRPLYADEIRSADHPRIRYFDVPDRFDFKQPRKDLDGGQWRAATPENVPDFSAVAYFFARELNARYDVPIGIINASLGGSPVQAWLSEEALKEFPEHYREAERFRDDILVRRIREADEKRIGDWYKTLDEKDAGKKSGEYLWAGGDIDTGEWTTMQVPGYWPERNGEPQNGVFWFRRTVNLPPELAGKPARLNLGRIVDADTAFINGTPVGSTSYQYPPRWYDVPGGALKAGPNTITVRVVSERERGGFVPDKNYELLVDGRRFDLAGRWRYRSGAKMPPLDPQTFIRWKPLGLYNGMIAPLTDYPVTGVIWYQGESNTSAPGEYHALFSRMIADWRQQWGLGDFPFLFVQLANFMEPAAGPSDSDWARLREAQLNTLSVPNTAMAVTIDIGEWNDIHPLNKEDVGKRLAAAAAKLAYKDDVTHSGPLYSGMERRGEKIVLSFRHVDGGLTARGPDGLQEFTIAGPDRKFLRARAEIRGDNVAVWNDQVPDPVAVRYAWADNPDKANLYNKAGFPASPFRTDNW